MESSTEEHQVRLMALVIDGEICVFIECLVDNAMVRIFVLVDVTIVTGLGCVNQDVGDVIDRVMFYRFVDGWAFLVDGSLNGVERADVVEAADFP
ncbi:hypothetical protein NDU88_001815 [Pleurodeles waltl]|uniref:Uncharacterized protein n=1 Tax=Pleurodeles waltl TaxID=8319 RepID=A0AAV7Q5E8_PLEWA|nr:hypothetical protein NDU88_001815 [Pleurodeles waltl]